MTALYLGHSNDVTTYNSKCAYPKVFTPAYSHLGFRVSGVFPFNTDVFGEDEFLASMVTGQPTVTGQPAPGENEPPPSVPLQ